jgi:hypothetical protein
MDSRRGCNAAPDEERWLFVGRHPCCPPLPEHRDDPGALFDEVERVVLLKVTALIAQWDDHGDCPKRQAVSMAHRDIRARGSITLGGTDFKSLLALDSTGKAKPIRCEGENSPEP